MTTWLTPTAAARRLGIALAELDALIKADLLERQLIGDHYSISAELVNDRLGWATRLAAPFRCKPAFMLRLAVYARLRSQGVESFEAASRIGRDEWSSAGRYERWLDLLGDRLDPAAQRQAGRPDISVGGGPDIGHAAEREFRASQADYTDTPNDEGDND